MKVNEIKTIMRSKTALFSMLVVLVLCANDFMQRFNVDTIETLKGSELDAMVTLVLPIVPQQAVHQLNQQYQQFQNDEEVVDNSIQEGLSVAEQLAQKGELQHVYVGDFRLALKAVIYQESLDLHRALIQKLNVKTNERIIEPFENGTTVESFHVEIINLTSVRLIRETVNGSQEIVLTLYQSTNKES